MTDRYIDPYNHPVFLGLTMAEFAELLKSLEQRRAATKMMGGVIEKAMELAPSPKEREEVRLRQLETETDHAMAASASVQMALALQTTEDTLAAEGRLDPDMRISAKEGEEGRISPDDAAQMRQRALEAAEAYDEALAVQEDEEEEPAPAPTKASDLASMTPKGRC